MFSTNHSTFEYPLFGLKFVDDDTFVVSGGGGEGRHGIPNEVAAFKLDKSNFSKELTKTCKYQFEKNATDAPMCFEYYEGKVYVGCNDSKSVIEKNKKNLDLKVLDVGKTLETFSEKVVSKNVFNNLDPQSYIKKITVFDAKSPKILLVNSDTKSKICLSSLTESTYKNLLPIDQEESEIKDLDTFEDEKSIFVSYIIKSALKSIKFGEKITITEEFSFQDKFVQYSKIVYLTNNKLLLLGSIAAHKQAIVHVYDLTTKKIVSKQTIASNVRSVNAVDFRKLVDSKFPNTLGFLAIATSDLSATLFAVSSNFKLQKLQKFDKIHSFAITNLKISPGLDFLVSTSADNSINSISLPNVQSLVDLGKGNFNVLIALLVVLIAIILGYLKAN